MKARGKNVDGSGDRVVTGTGDENEDGSGNGAASSSGDGKGTGTGTGTGTGSETKKGTRMDRGGGGEKSPSSDHIRKKG